MSYSTQLGQQSSAAEVAEPTIQGLACAVLIQASATADRLERLLNRLRAAPPKEVQNGVSVTTQAVLPLMSVLNMASDAHDRIARMLAEVEGLV